jgi:hypothetical protein
MSLFIFQITIKQWDKSQNTPAHQAARSAIPSVFTVTAAPTFNIFDSPCILEQHGDDVATNVFTNGRIRASVLSTGAVMFDRFQIINDSTGPKLAFLARDEGIVSEKKPQVLGPLNQHWIQARYTWRYSVLENNQIYWMYEEVILNAMCAEEFDGDCFLKVAPSITFNDL